MYIRHTCNRIIDTYLDHFKSNIVNIIKLSITLYVGAIVALIIYNNYYNKSPTYNIFNAAPYGFVDDSIKGQVHNIVLDGWGEYHISFWFSFQKPVITETGTYSDPGDNEITLIPKNGRPYKIRVWARGTKRPQYRIKP